MTLQPTQIKSLSADGFQWNQYSPRIATITNELTHFAQVAYFAFDSWDDAHAFWRSITDKRLCTRAQVRESERFTTHEWEVKVWSISPTTLDKLIDRDRNRQAQSLPLPQLRRDWPIAESYSAIAVRCSCISTMPQLPNWG